MLALGGWENEVWMSNQRLTRVNEVLKRQIAEDLFRLKAPWFEIGSVTITRVKVSPDLADARVGVSIFGYENKQNEILRFLKNQRGTLQQKINRSMHLKRTPRLHFELDESLKQGDRVLRLLNELDEQTESQDDPQ